MLTITATKLAKEFAKENNIDCALVDYALIAAAERSNSESFQGCTLPPLYAVSIQPAEDMVIPIFLCLSHFNALKMGLHEGVAVDEDIFGQF